MSDLPAGSDPRLASVLLSEVQLQRRVAELGARIAADYGGAGRVTLVGVLKGAWVFLADLARAIRRAGGPAVDYEFVRASTYGTGMKGAGEEGREVRIEGLSGPLTGKHVLLVEDILDQGFTLARIRAYLCEQERVGSLKLCVLLVKALEAPAATVAVLRRQLVPEYVGFEVPDRWVAGYGLDVGEEFRDLPYVAVIREECFRPCRGS
ncbi:MAG: hypoxanthine phosphoribosyltransferase [Lentisphaeria bacterium]|nr:hypoxanthine phosphoribosyltransferase [Lentisphaeria bacterium]